MDDSLAEVIVIAVFRELKDRAMVFYLDDCDREIKEEITAACIAKVNEVINNDKANS